jgi:YihY family inner membrane protein
VISVQRVGRSVIAEIRADQITFLAASLAYYAFVSLLPLLILALTVASVVGGPTFADSLAEQVGEALGRAAGDLVRDALTASLAQAGATAFGLVVLVWSGLKLFRGLDVAFSTVYDTPVGGIVDQVRNGIVALVAVGVGVAATIAVGTTIALFRFEVVGVDLVALVGTVALLAGLVVTFLPLYYVLPGGGVTVREALPGAALAAVGWTVLQTVFRVYAATAGTAAYGVLSGVLLLVTMLYFAGMLLLTGVVLNAVLAGRADETMSDSDDTSTEVPTDDQPGAGAPDEGPGGDALGPPYDDVDDEDVEAELRALRRRLEEFEAQVDERTVHRDEVERDLRRYVRRRVRRGKARGWGPYLVLLYGTAMTLGAFFYLSGGWAILAMIVIWLSTLGLYTLFVLVGLGISAASAPGRLRDAVQEFRS